jgi:PAS domain S-box-containing protein
MDHLPAATFIKDETGRVLFANRYLQELFGWQECLGKNTAELLPPEIAERMLADDQRVLREGLRVIPERITDIHGAEHFFDTYKFPISVEGAPTLLGGVAVDVTERKRMEQALEKRLVALSRPLDEAWDIDFNDLFNLQDIQRIQDLFAQITGVASLITAPDGTPLTQPSNFCRLCRDVIRQTELGRQHCARSDAVLGQHNPDGPIVQHCLSAGLCGAGASITIGGKHIANWLIGQVRDETVNEEDIRDYARALGADTDEILAAFREIPTMPEDHFKRIAQTLFVLANQLSATAYQNVQQARFITERRQAEEALRQEKDFAEDIITTLPGIFYMFDTQGNFIRWNRKVEEVTGYSALELTTRHVTDFFEGAEKEIALNTMQTTVEEGQSSVELTLITKEGKKIPYFFTGKRTILGGCINILGLGLDITDRKRAEEEQAKLETQMREVQKLESLGVLAGGIAHDFNNLLMAILGNAELALLTLSPASPACPNLEEITRASQRAADLCRQMLAYSGKGRFLVGRYDLSEIVREMAQMLEVSISKKARLRYSFAKELPPVEADATQLRQVIMNLITNASEALMDQSGYISVSTGVMDCDQAYLSESYLDDQLPEGSYVYLEVADTGIGMDQETQRRIFDPFFTTKFTGRGLGLAAVLGIVRGHQGAIKVYSEPGRGSTFKVLLPAGKKLQEEEMPGEAQDAPTLPSGTILLIDDDPEVRKVGSLMLKRLGYKVLTATRGQEGLEIFRACGGEITCVILDLTMPEMGGEEVFRELRRLRSDVSVILTSGYNEQDVIQHFAGKGLAGFIQKPYRLANLRETLHNLLSSK